MENEKGITLVSLVITIIVLLILASIAIYSGKGTIKYANFNKAKAEIQTILVHVNSWNEENVEVGLLTSDSSCDQTTLNETIQETGITIANYRFLSAEYLKQNLGLDASFDYLVNIINRDVILLGGVDYNGKIYYTLSDFGITKVESNLPSLISFSLAQGENTDIVISDVKLKTSSEETGTDFSKFIVQYKKTTDEIWKDVTSSITKFVDDQDSNKIKYKFSVSEIGNYQVKIMTIDKKIEQDGSIRYSK